MYRKQTPEAWHAQVLNEESVRLVAAIRELEYESGLQAGQAVGFRVGVNSIALALRSTEEKTGDSTKPAVAG